MKKAILILALVASTAHARMEKDAYEMYDMRNLQTEKTTVSIIRADNVPVRCEAESKKRGFGGFRGASMEACSFHDKSNCTIVVGWKTNNDILGHELRHCFAGNFH